MAQPLDAGIWRTRPCGTVGPVGLAAEAAVEGNLLYASLFDHHLAEPTLPGQLSDYEFAVHASRPALAVAPGVGGQHSAIDNGFQTARDDDVFGVTAHRSNSLISVMAAIPRYEDAATAFIVHWWLATSPSENTQVVNLAVWQMMQHEAASRGYLGIVTSYNEATLQDRFTNRLGLFRSASAALAAHGLEGLTR